MKLNVYTDGFLQSQKQMQQQQQPSQHQHFQPNVALNQMAAAVAAQLASTAAAGGGSAMALNNQHSHHPQQTISLLPHQLAAANITGLPANMGGLSAMAAVHSNTLQPIPLLPVGALANLAPGVVHQLAAVGGQHPTSMYSPQAAATLQQDLVDATVAAAAASSAVVANSTYALTTAHKSKLIFA